MPTKLTSIFTFGNSAVLGFQVSLPRHAELISGQVEHTLSFVEAVRLLTVEAGEVDDEEYSELYAAITAEIHDDPPEGIDSIMGKWGYWWVMK
jgi:hypothetical protein